MIRGIIQITLIMIPDSIIDIPIQYKLMSIINLYLLSIISATPPSLSLWPTCFSFFDGADDLNCVSIVMLTGIIGKC